MQINWKFKNFVFHVFKILPYGDKLYYFSQNKITKRVWMNDENFRKRYMDKVQRHCDIIEKYGEMPLKNSTVFEFGAGWNMLTPIGFAMRREGVKRYIAVDLNVYVHPELLKNTLSLYGKNRDIINAECGYTAIDEVIEIQDENPLEFLQKNYNIEYHAPMDAGNTPFESKIVDYVVSNVSLEHIPEEDINRIFRECHRLLRPGGLMSLTVDCSDHYAHSDASISVFNYLKYSEQEWKKYNTSMHYQNRLRNSDYKRLLEHNGFEIIENNKHVDKDNIRLLKEIQLSDCFKKYDENDLLVTFAHFVARKPQKSI